MPKQTTQTRLFAKFVSRVLSTGVKDFVDSPLGEFHAWKMSLTHSIAKQSLPSQCYNNIATAFQLSQYSNSQYDLCLIAIPIYEFEWIPPSVTILKVKSFVLFPQTSKMAYSSLKFEIQMVLIILHMWELLLLVILHVCTVNTPEQKNKTKE